MKGWLWKALCKLSWVEHEKSFKFLVFLFYDQVKFHAQLSWAWKKFYNLGAGNANHLATRTLHCGAEITNNFIRVSSAYSYACWSWSLPYMYQEVLVLTMGLITFSDNILKHFVLILFMKTGFDISSKLFSWRSIQLVMLYKKKKKKKKMSSHYFSWTDQENEDKVTKSNQF